MLPVQKPYSTVTTTKVHMYSLTKLTVQEDTSDGHLCAEILAFIVGGLSTLFCFAISFLDELTPTWVDDLV